MNVRELIEALEGQDPDMEVLIGHQPSWPLAETLDAVQAEADLLLANECDEHGRYDCQVCAAGGEPVVWLVSGGAPLGRSPYAPGALFGSGV